MIEKIRDQFTSSEENTALININSERKLQYYLQKLIFTLTSTYWSFSIYMIFGMILYPRFLRVQKRFSIHYSFITSASLPRFILNRKPLLFFFQQRNSQILFRKPHLGDVQSRFCINHTFHKSCKWVNTFYNYYLISILTSRVVFPIVMN